MDLRAHSHYRSLNTIKQVQKLFILALLLRPGSHR